MPCSSGSELICREGQVSGGLLAIQTVLTGVYLSTAWFKVYARDGTPFDSETELQIVLKQVYTKPDLRIVLANAVYNMDYLNDKLNDFWPKAFRIFDDSELAQFEWTQV